MISFKTEEVFDKIIKTVLFNGFYVWILKNNYLNLQGVLFKTHKKERFEWDN